MGTDREDVTSKIPNGGVGSGSLSELVQFVTLHVRNPIVLSVIVLPFVLLYLTVFYLWIFVYGFEDFYDAGLIAVVAIAFEHIITILCCFCCFCGFDD